MHPINLVELQIIHAWIYVKWNSSKNYSESFNCNCYSNKIFSESWRVFNRVIILSIFSLFLTTHRVEYLKQTVLHNSPTISHRNVLFCRKNNNFTTFVSRIFMYTYCQDISAFRHIWKNRWVLRLIWPEWLKEIYLRIRTIVYWYS